MIGEPTQGVHAELVSALRAVLSRDPQALRTPDHLDALLGDLAPTLPRSVRHACSAAAATGLADFLPAAPGISVNEATSWLTARAGLAPADAAEVVAAFAELLGLSLPSYPLAPTQAPAAHPGYQFAETAAPDSLPPGIPYSLPPVVPAGVMSPNPPPTSLPVPPPQVYPYQNQPARRSRKPWLIAAVIAVLLAGAGVGVGLAVTSNNKPSTAASTRLTAPQHVRTMADGSGVMVSWQPVKGAAHYHVLDRTGRLTPVTVTGTSHTFANASATDHEFVVVAMSDSMQMSPASAVVVWHGQSPKPKPNPKPKPPPATTLSAPTNPSTMRQGYGVMVSWNAVDGAQQYRVYDGSAQPATVTGTSYVIPNAIYAEHHFTIVAVHGTVTSPRSAVAMWMPQHHLSTAEQALAYRLATGAARPGSCEGDPSYERQYTEIRAAILCVPARGARRDGPTILFAAQLRRGTMQSYERASFGDAIRGPETNACVTGNVPSTGAHEWWHFGQSNQRIGDLACYVSKTDDRVLAWTYDDDDVVVKILGKSPTSFDGLFAWFHNSNHDIRLNS